MLISALILGIAFKLGVFNMWSNNATTTQIPSLGLSHSFPVSNQTKPPCFNRYQSDPFPMVFSSSDQYFEEKQ
jgi:hypothetical protein